MIPGTSKKYWILGLLFLITLVVFLSGYRPASYFAHVRELERAELSRPTAQSILLALKGQGFLITQTYVVNQTVMIDHSSGSFFKDLFWNQIISATANVKVSSGVDLSKLIAADIEQNGNKLTISLPVPTQYSTEVVGAVSVKNKQGVLKQLLDNDDGYNQALDALKSEAQNAAATPELKKDLQHASTEEIRRLIGLIIPGLEVDVLFN